MNSTIRPPRWARWLLNRLHPEDTLEEVEGDLDELYTYWYNRAGRAQATLRYVLNVVSVLPPFVRRRHHKHEYDQQPSNLHLNMIRNYLKIAFRNLIKNKAYSAINIGGLAFGMAVAMLIGLWIYDELSFNKYHKNYDRIARIMMTSTNPTTGVTKENTGLWLPVEEILKNNYGQYFSHVATVWYTGDMTLTVGNQNFTKKGNYLGSDVIEMLTLEMLQGDRRSLADPHAMIISESTASALFGNSNPINQPIKIDNRMDGIVKGVYKNLPQNTTYAELDVIVSFELWKLSNEWVRNGGWNSIAYNFLVQLAPNVSIEQANAGIKDLFRKYGPAETAKDNARYKPMFYLYPMHDWHLYSEFKNGRPVGGRITFVWMFGLIGLFVLILACINFMNLSTARSQQRAKEVGIRKAMGSIRIQLVNQFFSESYLIVIVAFFGAIILVLLSLKPFGEIAGKPITIPYSNSYFWLFSILFVGITGFLSGIYPALYLSSFQAIKILKGTFRVGKYAAVPRKVLVVLQFSVSVTLIIGTFVVYKQINYAQNRPVGYDRNRLITVPMNDPNYYGKHEVLKAELLNSGYVSAVGFSFSPLTQVWDNISGFTWKGRATEQESDFAVQKIDYDFGKTVDWKLIRGRDYSEAFGADSSNLIINEAAMKYLGFKDPIGKQVLKRDENKYFTIIGVIKDLIMTSPYEPVKQTFFFLQKKGYANQIHIKLKNGFVNHKAVSGVEAAFKKIVPSAAFNYKFVDEEYNKKFTSEQRIGTLASLFAILAILISCLGLFGLASYVAEQRTKEIGIRKVLGATVASLWQILCKDFVILVIISCLLAAPIAYSIMDNWLQTYTYRTEISWWIFLVTDIGALVITLMTVSFQAIKAALMNPVKSLRSE